MLLGKNQTKELAKKLSPDAIQFRNFVGSDFKFLKLEYLVESPYSDSIIDPLSYQLHPVSKFSDIYVNDKQPLLMEQCQTSGEIKVSAIVALRKRRAEKSPKILITEPQKPASCSKLGPHSTQPLNKLGPHSTQLTAAQPKDRSISTILVLKRRSSNPH